MKAIGTQDFPAVFQAADQHAARTQKQYFRMLAAQYFCLFVASLLTLISGTIDQTLALTLYFALLVSGALAALNLGTSKPNENWYRFRALAESCKTLSWRYMMGSEPFTLQLDAAKTQALLAERLHELVSFQQLGPGLLIACGEAEEQATPAMHSVRQQDFAQRKEIYLANRIDNQMNWYKMKARHNQRASKISLFAIVMVYLVAMGATGLQLYQPFYTGQVLWIAEPLLVLAASVLGFAQAKRFSELSASYALTALEIQKLRTGFVPIADEPTFVAYVNTAEDAFSREHTQWIARVI